MNKFKQWLKPVSILLGLLLLSVLLPNIPIDPWNLLNLKKMATMIFALALIQTMGSTMVMFLGTRIGAVLTGFLGGLISSTATTASLARKSITDPSKNHISERLTFLAATLAMLVESMAIVLFGSNDLHLKLLVVFLGPAIVTCFVIYRLSVNYQDHPSKIENVQLNVKSILKLSGFIIGILAISKLSQKVLGQSGLFILTFIVSLFEIHGSAIANVQLHDAGEFSLPTLANLLAISVIASYVSKLFLIYTLGNHSLRRPLTSFTLSLFLVLLGSLGLFHFID